MMHGHATDSTGAIRRRKMNNRDRFNPLTGRTMRIAINLAPTLHARSFDGKLTGPDINRFCSRRTV
jgi:hypothetical protein